MARRDIEVDSDKLDAVQALLGTTTPDATVDAALEEVLALERRRRGLLAERGAEAVDLSDPEARRAAWD
jgi:Arc/MetJ family transcription regulator